MKKYFIFLWSIPAVLLVGLVLVSGIVTQHVSAATGSIYLTPTSATVLSGANLTFTLRINPGTAVSGVEATVTFDTAKLQYVSASTAGSAFAAQLQQTVTGGNVNVARGDFGGGVSGDSLIETITFKSLVGSGSTNVTLSAGNATDQANPGTYTNPSLSGATISFSAPAPTPTPTPTPAPTPSPTPSPTPTPAPGTNTTPSSTPTSPTTQSTTAPTAPAPAGTSQPAAGGTAATVSDVQPNVQYTLASVSFNTTTPTTAAIKYGLDPKLSITTPSSESATAHTVTLDPALLVPGQTYYYAIVTTDTAGHTSQSQVQTFKTRGLSLKIAVFAADHTPLRNTMVTLRSKAYTVKTDSNGIASITDVTPGVHHLEYTPGKNVLSQIVRVEPTITTVGSKQSAAIQNFSVIYNVKPTKHVNFMVFGPLLLLIAVGGYFFIRRERNVLSTPVTESSAILTAVPTIAVPNSSSNPSSSRLNTPSSDTVSRIPYPSTPNPGDTVTPHTNERNQ